MLFLHKIERYPFITFEIAFALTKFPFLFGNLCLCLFRDTFKAIENKIMNLTKYMYNAEH